ncbi:ABC transporter permease [Aurantiacibacter luteus]|uniref:ABC-2 type transporter transmembrane domain-containing protein n=1 Tax=Aurantiacibacter luteus TaxID=1581420 RepID=A0A0G9MZ15_9SPHN|nr:ABC transporter permease [Aurantiacibacter luteus]KLE34523.1 hypothetical protein AAW00_09925 [Aurantiacibacter luteus]
MRDVLLVAIREIRQITATKGFWIMLMALPVAIAVSGFASSAFAPEDSTAYTVVDETGTIGEGITERLALRDRQQELRDLAEYAERYDLQAIDPQAPWADRQAWLSEAEVRRFAEAGGAEAAVERIAPDLPAGVPPFELEDPSYVAVPLPDGVALTAANGEMGSALQAAFENDIAVDGRTLPYGAVLYIPQNFGEPGAAARVYTNGRSNQTLIQAFRDGLDGALRDRMFAAQGIAPATAQAIEGMAAPLAVIDPPPGSGRTEVMTRSLVPLALVYLLLITAVTTGSMMLQGVVEERSNKLFESVLACIRPDALMQGKLLGLGAVGIVIVLVWAGTGLAGAMYFEGFAAEVVKPSLAALDDPLLIAAMIFYFFAGYIVLAMLFLAIGAVSESMQDAQSYLTPAILLVMIPVMILMQAAIGSPNSPVVQVLSWVPLYTPFAMLARLATGVATWEILGTIALMVAFIWIELKLLGRIFRASLLNDGKPTLKRIASWVRSPGRQS